MFINMMVAGDVFLRFRDIVFAAVFNQIRIAHTDKWIRVIKQNLRLGPADDAPFRRIRLNACANPCGIAGVIIGTSSAAGPWIVPHVTNEMAAMVVEPIQVFAVRALPHEIRRTRMFHQTSVLELFVIWRLPCATAIAAVCLHWMTVNAPIGRANG